MSVSDLPESRESLWTLAASPLAWAAHFLLSYVTAAVWCAKFAKPGDSLSGVRVAIGVYTVLALAVIAVVGARGWRRHRHGHAPLPHDADTPEDRHRFLGFATVLLSGLSAVAVLYASLAAVFIGDCR
jgi:hypothetical protein